MPISISRKYTDSDFGGNPSLDDKITIFEDRVLGWQLDIAEEVRKRIENTRNHGRPIRHAGFALISILFSYFEMIAQYQQGEESEGSSQQFFKLGIDSVFPGRFSEEQKRLIYKRIRCGMYHSGLTKKGALISGDYPEPIQIENDLVKVNPHRLSRKLKTHFLDYIERLRKRESMTALAHFEQMFDKAKKV
jgi:hypothetical protein